MTIPFTQKERKAAVKQVSSLVSDIDQKLTELELLCDEFGIAAEIELAGRTHRYQPKRPNCVSAEDVYDDPDVEWLESESDDPYYGQVTGWTNSSTYC